MTTDKKCDSCEDCECEVVIPQLSFTEMFEAYVSGIVGVVEFRSWLARRDQDFMIIRDPDVDEKIQQIAEKAQIEGFTG